jgi:putative iron-only hydrogenase system regulator
MGKWIPSILGGKRKIQTQSRGGLGFFYGEPKMEKRLGVVGIVIEDRKAMAGQVNQILSQHAEIIVGRMGLPYKDRQVAVIALIVDGSTDELGSLTGKLGMMKGIRVVSALKREKPKDHFERGESK